MITPEAIEAGAKAQYEDNTGHKWGSKPDFMAIWRHHAYTVLSAAAPFMRSNPASRDTIPSEVEVEELTELIATPRMHTNTSGDQHRATANAVLAEGYRKVEVLRVITTVEELDELPLLAVVLNNGPNPLAWQKHHDLTTSRHIWYCTTDSDKAWESYYILEDGEATVLWEPPLPTGEDE
jgi:hypothetical protein